jgi:hypothetical protein
MLAFTPEADTLFCAAQFLCFMAGVVKMPNLTIKIDDEELIRRAKMLAAQKGTSLSGLVRDYLETLVHGDDEYERARRQALRWIRRGLPLGGKPLTREEAHERD